MSEISETAKYGFMLRLRSMINHLGQTNDTIKHYCPASITPTRRFLEPPNEILSEEHCDTCREVMDVPGDGCPCIHYGIEATKEAEKRIHKYFDNEEK